MIRSLFSGASGMKNHQIRMDVIGNNVANVNTTGFKGSRTNFQDILYQTVRYPSAGVDNIGGINPSQVGLGVMVSSITNNTGQGGLQNTGRSLDLAVNGNGWYVLSTNGEAVAGTGEINERYSREGIFYIDNVGNIVNSSGYNLCDVGGNPIQLDIASSGVATINISKDGWISYTLLDGTKNDNAFQIGLAMFPNQDGLERDGLNMYKISPTSGNAVEVFGAPGGTTGGYGTINSGFLEMSNVDLTDEFVNMITTQRGYQANARTVTTSDQILEELLNIKR
ncbi:MAG: Flagellar basal-body rod protein FlgG [Pelotomaculum sp. PtaB.Bin104]|uniref:Flagellar hook protein FlgE n=1 Tax=Pelotomaculum isophthalicicum JI TaxID=947010 RepID=A0A9X4H6W5_9FIRM|nr:flagellar hook-basal body complex protein [Pelotomaculum isophthalicicum]MDF9409308.1 flagellar hook-basal body complex protein [Pelotomaculum isophthalicicum JI]OPX92396.1 MAG: Flagellar basal-body rod protein FlgG [Pelotomaculum sp. PtaB.Bin104]